LCYTALVPSLDEIWIAAAAKLELPVARGGEAYVHFDGRVLHIAGDEHLDADDTVAQLVLHELCHALVQGPAARHMADWGLDNTTDRDEERERAAVRLQAHLTGAWGLRAHLFPTTPVRAFFEALPKDAFADRDPSAELARAAAERAVKWAPLLEALEASASLLAVPRHRNGFPLGARRCGECAWRTDGGMCRRAPRRLRVAVEERGCAKFEPPFECEKCGACCRAAYDSVTVAPRDLVRKRHPELLVDRGSYLELRREGDRCAALAGPAGGPWSCRIYDDRPRTCREFAAAGRHCLEARRRVGLTA
jgi:hypothetical protein